MKKFVTMVMVLMMVLTAPIGVADEDFKPIIHLNDLKNMSFEDDYDLHVTMYVSMPEWDSVRLEINVSFNDNENDNYNSGWVFLYDNEGNYIDGSVGNINKEIDCSSKDVEKVRENLLDYLNNFDFEKEYKETGIRYYSIWF